MPPSAGIPLLQQSLQSSNRLTANINDILQATTIQLQSVQSALQPIQPQLKPLQACDTHLPLAIEQLLQLQSYTSYIDSQNERSSKKLNPQQSLHTAARLIAASLYFTRNKQYVGISTYIQRCNDQLKPILADLLTSYEETIHQTTKTSPAIDLQTPLPLSYERYQIPTKLFHLLHQYVRLLLSVQQTSFVTVTAAARSAVLKALYKKIYYDRVNQVSAASTPRSANALQNTWQQYQRGCAPPLIFYSFFSALAACEFQIIQRIVAGNKINHTQQRRYSAIESSQPSHSTDDDDDDLLPPLSAETITATIQHCMAQTIEYSQSSTSSSSSSPLQSFTKKYNESLSKLKAESVQLRILMLLETLQMHQRCGPQWAAMLKSQPQSLAKLRQLQSITYSSLCRTVDEYKDQYILHQLDGDLAKNKRSNQVTTICPTVIDTLSYLKRLWEYSSVIDEFADYQSGGGAMAGRRASNSLSVNSAATTPAQADMRRGSVNGTADSQRSVAGQEPPPLHSATSTDASSTTVIDINSFTDLIIAALESAVRTVAKRQLASQSESAASLFTLNNTNAIARTLRRENRQGEASEALPSPNSNVTTLESPSQSTSPPMQRQASSVQPPANIPSLAYYYTNRVTACRQQFHTISWKKLLDVLDVREIGPVVLSAVANITSPPVTSSLSGSEPLSVDVSNHTGQTALMFAVKRRKLSVVKQLVEEFYATLNVTDTNGMTAYDHACALKYDEIVQYLRQRQREVSTTPQSGKDDIIINPNPHAAQSIHVSNKQIRQTLKTKFALFNDLMEHAYNLHRAYTVPDIELRTALRRDVIDSVAYRYRKLHTIGSQVEFSTSADKYIRYPPEVIVQMCNTMYEGSG